jgi:hypothetical protein
LQAARAESLPMARSRSKSSVSTKRSSSVSRIAAASGADCKTATLASKQAT